MLRAVEGNLPGALECTLHLAARGEVDGHRRQPQATAHILLQDDPEVGEGEDLVDQRGASMLTAWPTSGHRGRASPAAWRSYRRGPRR